MVLLTCLLFFIAIIPIALILFKLCFKLTTGWCTSNVCLVDKTVIVTGANTGIGYTAAEDFAKRGARVILACRDEHKGKKAADQITEATDNKNVVYKHLDLSSLKSVREFAQDINKSENRLDILLNNAGAVFLGNGTTEDGLLLIMATNYFGHFLLTNLLLDLIKKTPQSRIVNVSSRSAKSGSVDLNNLNQYPEGGRWWTEIATYSRTKLCNILFTIELAERLKGTSVTTYSVHPGAVVTEAHRYIPIGQTVMENIGKWFIKNSIEGAQTSIYCSVAKGIEYLSGENFEDCHFIPRYKSAEDPDLPKKLWELSCEMVKLNQKED